MMRLRRLFPAVLILAVAPVGAQGQDAWNAGQFYATRVQLQDMLAKYEAGKSSSAYSDAVRSIAGDEAGLIRTRLEKGDFEVGDVITMQVAGQLKLTDDFTVAPGYLLVLPEIDEPVQLKGVLRSELHDVVMEHLSKYLRDPRVYVQTKVNIAVWGDVANPGYYTVPAESRLTDVLVRAGQPNQTAKVDKLRIKRGDETIWDGEDLQLAITQGRTLDQLNLRAGDSIDVPGASTRSWLQIFQALYWVAPVGYAISQIFK